MAAIGITVLKRNAPWGPFTREQIADGLERGDFTLAYLACAPGLKEWLPLGEVLDYVARQENAPMPALPPVPVPRDLPPIPPKDPAPSAVVIAPAQPPVLPSAPAKPAEPPPPKPQAPPIPAAKSEPAPELEKGPFFLRFIAFLVDCGILFIPVALLFVLGALSIFVPTWFHHTSHQAISEQWGQLGHTLRRLAGILAIGCGWFYAAGLESSPRQATIGKRWMGLKVTDARGERLTFGRATGRYAAKYLSALPCFLGFILALFSSRGLALHDRVAGTRVVRN
jgi:uncharacterized RDD family membrane protein YckC